MRIINPSFEIINRPNGHEVLRHLDFADESAINPRMQYRTNPPSGLSA